MSKCTLSLPILFALSFTLNACNLNDSVGDEQSKDATSDLSIDVLTDKSKDAAEDEMGDAGEFTLALEPSEGVTLSVNETLQLNAQVLLDGVVLPGAEVQWESQDEDVAEVSPSGELTGRSQGTTSLVASHQGAQATLTVEVTLGGFIQVSLMKDAACALDVQGMAWCWGDNTQRQLGNATSEKRLTPLQTQTEVAFTQLDSSDQHTCAVSKDQDVYCWGDNQNNQSAVGPLALAPNTIDVPTRVGISEKVEQVVVSNAWSCAISLPARDVLCWGGVFATGIGGAQRLTDNDCVTGQCPTTLRATALFEGSTSLVGAQSNICAITTDQAVVCWANSSTQNTKPIEQAFEDVPMGTPNVVSASSSANHTCVVKSEGGAICLGANQRGELGDGTTQGPREVFEEVMGEQTFEHIMVSSRSSCGLTADKSLYCWGDSSVGQLAQDDRRSQRAPVRVPLQRVVQFDMTDDKACAITDQHELYCWGARGDWSLGDGIAQRSSDFVEVGVELGVSFVEVVSATDHACALDRDGAVYCWGLNDVGQLGIGSRANTSITRVNLPSPATQITLTNTSTCALLDNQALYCWGGNTRGEAGLGMTLSADTPVKLEKAYTAISSWDSAVCGRTTKGELNCWGSDLWMSGCLRGSCLAPTQQAVVGELLDFVVGENHLCTLLEGGSVKCRAGKDEDYGLGRELGDPTSRENPVMIDTRQMFVRVLTSSQTMFAVDVKGDLYSWGRNDIGQRFTMPSTISAPGVEFVTQRAFDGVVVGGITGNVNLSCAILLDENNKPFMDNVYCQGSAPEDSSPGAIPFDSREEGAPIPTNKAWLDWTLSLNYGCGVSSKNALFCWGSRGSGGQLGDGYSKDALTPTRILKP